MQESELVQQHGTTVMVTDLDMSNSTNFFLSSRAFSTMASKGKASDVLKLDLNGEDFIAETMTERRRLLTDMVIGAVKL
ncbi:hypothetical protein LINPERPRIM_LOCUS20690 [Linum perenne]